jgi:GH24 family phage-related lysozyme (muramidase)
MIPTRYINAGPMQPKASAGAAMAAGQAVESIGAAITDVGQSTLAVAGKLRKIKEAGAINAFMAQADEEAGRFAIELARRSDTEAWPADWQSRASKLREKAQGLGLSPEAMGALDSQFTNWSSTRSIHFETQAASKDLGIARSRTTQALDYSLARGDKEGYDRALATATAGGVLNPAEEEQARAVFKTNEAALDLDRLVEGNPQGVIDTPEEQFLKTMPGATLEQVAAAKRKAEVVVKDRAFDTVEAAQDEILTGKLTTPEMIDQNPRYAGLRPVVRERLKRGLQEYQFEKTQGVMNTPEAQAEVVGAVSMKLADWDPKAAEDADLKYAEIQGLIGRLPEGAMRNELSRQAKAIRTGAWAESVTQTDTAMRALDAAGKAGRFGQVPEVKSLLVSEVVAAGFLDDPAKLKSLGYNDDQVAAIRAEKGNPQRLQKFRELWTKRGDADKDVSRTVWNIGSAIRNGTNQVPNPEGEDAAITARINMETKLGEAKMKLTEYLRTNSKASQADIEGKILEIGGEQTHRELKSGLYDGKKATSGGPAGASDSTASLPVGNNLTEIVKHFEAGGAPGGFHEKAYWDYGQWSIGYGTKSKEGETISKAEGEKRLAAELGSHRGRVETEAKRLGLSFTPAELDALTSFDYNTGKIETLLAGGKRSKREIADTMPLYRNAGGDRIPGLERRRKAERHLFLHGHAGDSATAQNTGEISDPNVIQ